MFWITVFSKSRNNNNTTGACAVRKTLVKFCTRIQPNQRLEQLCCSTLKFLHSSLTMVQSCHVNNNARGRCGAARDASHARTLARCERHERFILPDKCRIGVSNRVWMPSSSLCSTQNRRSAMATAGERLVHATASKARVLRGALAEKPKHRERGHFPHSQTRTDVADLRGASIKTPHFSAAYWQITFGGDVSALPLPRARPLIRPRPLHLWTLEVCHHFVA